MAPKKGIKAEKPALTLNLDKEAADDLEYIARLVGMEPGDALSLALGILKKVAEEKRKGNRTYIDIGSGRKEEILVGQAETLAESLARRQAEMDKSVIYPTGREANKYDEEMKKIRQSLEELRQDFKRLADSVGKK